MEVLDFVGEGGTVKGWFSRGSDKNLQGSKYPPFAPLKTLPMRTIEHHMRNIPFVKKFGNFLLGQFH